MTQPSTPAGTSAGFAAAPVVVSWEATRACDLACEHCRADAQPDPYPGELSTGEAERLIDQIAGFPRPPILVFSGGDPLKRPDLFDLISYASDHGLPTAVTPAPTDLLTPETIARLADAGARRIALSLDGRQTTHDAFRGHDGSYQAILDAATMMGDHGLSLQINTTVTKTTRPDLPHLEPLVEELGAVLWAVFFLVPVGRGTTLEPIIPDEAEELMHWLARVSDRASFDVKTTEAPMYRRVLLTHHTPATNTAGRFGRRVGVTAGNGFVFVDHQGNVLPSGFLPRPTGNVRETSLVTIYQNHPLFHALRDPDLYRGKCGACEYRYVCGGSRSRAYAHTDNPLDSDPLCPYIPNNYEGPLPTTLIG